MNYGDKMLLIDKFKIISKLPIVTSMHLCTNLCFKMISCGDFLKLKSYLFYRTDFHDARGSRYYITIYDGYVCYVRRSNHWGEFTSNNKKEGFHNYHNWVLLDDNGLRISNDDNSTLTGIIKLFNVNEIDQKTALSNNINR
jgi:hypothetical protein